MAVFYNQDDVSNSLLNRDIVMNYAAITLIDPTNLRAVFSTPYGTQAVSVSLDLSTEYLTYALNLANFPPITTSGLLGTFNGDPSDNFMYPDGTILAPDASDPMIHEWGQTCMLFCNTLNLPLYICVL